VDNVYFEKVKRIGCELPGINYLDFVGKGVYVEFMPDGNQLNLKGAELYSPLISEGITLQEKPTIPETKKFWTSKVNYYFCCKANHKQSRNGKQ